MSDDSHNGVKPRLAYRNTGDSVVTAAQNGVRTYFTIPKDGGLLGIQNLNLKTTFVNGVPIHAPVDDPAPMRLTSVTIGGNHGYIIANLKVVAHGLTNSSIGSIWSLGGNLHVIVGITSSSLIAMARQNSELQPSTGTYTYVSGGGPTANLVATTTTTTQLTACYQNKTFTVNADNELVGTATAIDVTYTDAVVMTETYEILSRAQVLNWFIANGNTGSTAVSGTAFAEVTNVYRFDRTGNLTHSGSLLFLQPVTDFKDMMGMQSSRLTTVIDGAIQYYIPKTLPVTHQSINYDFANIDVVDTTTWTSRLRFTPARCEAAGLMVDRVVQLSDRYGYALGYLPVQSADPSVRRANTTVKSLELSNSRGKVYPSLIDNGITTIAAGTFFSFIGYRNFFVRPAGRTTDYVVRTEGDDYFFVDWHDVTGVLSVPVPPDLNGRSFTVVEARNATLLSTALCGVARVDVSATGGYAYVILQVEK